MVTLEGFMTFHRPCILHPEFQFLMQCIKETGLIICKTEMASKWKKKKLGDYQTFV